MYQQYRSELRLILAVLVALCMAICTKSESIYSTSNERKGTSRQKVLLEKTLTVEKRQAIETGDRDVEYPQFEQGDQLMAMFEALNASILTELARVKESLNSQTAQLDELKRGQEDLASKVDECETDHEPEPEQVYSGHPGSQKQYYCHSAWELGIREPGVYTLSLPGYPSFSVRCEFDGLHGWTVFQRRFDGSVNFYLPWDFYKRGFGNPHGEYWLGNEKIFSLTRRNRKLSIYLMRWDGEEATANYSNFYISNESDNYRLSISGYSGNAGYDSMAHSNGRQFSTSDRDNDAWSRQCADERKGAWWYGVCARSNLNGLYTNSSTGDHTNIVWYGDWSEGYSRPLRRSTMMITRD